MANNVLNWVWEHSRSRHAARLVLLAIADRAREDGTAWPSNTELRRMTGLGERSVQAGVTELVKLGELYVGIQQGPNGVNRYRVLMKVSKRTPAKSAPPPQDLHPAESAPPQILLGEEFVQVEMLDPAESAPPQNLRAPAGSADGTHTKTKQSKPAAKSSRPAKPSKHEIADALTDAFWDRHKGATAQSFLAIRGIIRTALANGVPRNDVAHALDRLAREGTAISGGSITNAIKQNRNPGRVNGHAVASVPAGISPRDEYRLRR